MSANPFAIVLNGTTYDLRKIESTRFQDGDISRTIVFFNDGELPVNVDTNAFNVAYDAAWLVVEAGLGSGVTAVNGHTGVVTLVAVDVGADANGAAATAQAAAIAAAAIDATTKANAAIATAAADATAKANAAAAASDTVGSATAAQAAAIAAAASTALAIANNLSDLSNVALARTHLGLDSGAKKVIALTDGSTINTDASLGSEFTVTLGGSRTMANPTNPTDGQLIVYRLKQDGSGSKLITWGSAFRFGADITSPTLSTAASKTDYIGFQYNGTDSTWDCVAVARGY